MTEYVYVIPGDDHLRIIAGDQDIIKPLPVDVHIGLVADLMDKLVARTIVGLTMENVMYGREDNLAIGGAISHMRRGQRVARRGWNGRNMWLKFHPANSDTKMQEYIVFKTVDGTLVPWSPSITDVLASDWFVIKQG